MTVESPADPAEDRDLIDLANYALVLIRGTPCIKCVREVTPIFVLDMALTIFGSHIIPFAEPKSPKEELENFKAVVDKLSVEIDADLSHIAPLDLQLGRRRAVSNFLELLAAFIDYCVSNDLLDFEAELSNSNSIYSRNLGVECALGSSNMHSDETEPPTEFIEFHLSTSPELPRSVNRIYPALTILQQHVQATPTSSSSSSDKQDNQIYAKEDQILNKLDKSNMRSQSDFNSTTTLLMHRRHPSLLTMQTDISPPATPKAVDAIMEIEPTKSPVTTAPSLQCSPIFRDSKKNHLTNDATLTVACSTEAVFNPTEFKSDSLDLNKLDDLMSQSSTTSIKSPRNFSSSSACLGILSDPENCPPTLDSLSHRSGKLTSSYKHSSSSSGRGRSPTPTAPGISNTSAPQSLTESILVTDLNKLPHESIESPKAVSVQSKPKQSSSQLKQSHTSLDSLATASILAWDQTIPTDHIRPGLKTNTTYTDSSFLSSFLNSHLETSHADDRHESSSKSQILSCIEGLPHTLKQRLDYLWTIISRAHSEAEAVSNLVQTLEDLGFENPNPKPRCRKTHSHKSHRTSRTDLNTFHLEDILRKISNGIDTILDTISMHLSFDPRPPNSKHCHICSTSRRHTCSRKRTKRTCHGSANEYRYEKDEEYPDSEFEDLMKMRHKCMVRGLRMCLRQLNSNRSQQSDCRLYAT